MERGGDMKFFRDRQIKGYFIFQFIFMIILFTFGIYFCQKQVSAVRLMYLEHDIDIASSLLEQEVPEEVVVTAITSTTKNANGTELLNSIGINKETSSSMIPFLSEFQIHSCYLLLSGIIVSAVILLTGTFIFLKKRSKLYEEAYDIVNCLADGDFSRHLPQHSEGEIYQLFASVENLATMLQSKNQTEQKTKEFLKQTISDISHQLKTPLAALLMYQEIIENEPENKETVEEFSQKIGIALKRMEQLIQSMLKITRLDTGNVIFEKKRCLVKDVVENGVNDLTTRAKNEDKKIVMDGNPELSFLCDMNWTSEAIGNFVKNALDHTEAGGIISITWEEAPNMLRIYITDNGMGITPEDIHHIFKRFYRSKYSLDRQGIGIGLPLAKSIIEGQNGLISVQSILHQGTTFTLSFLTKP